MLASQTACFNLQCQKEAITRLYMDKKLLELKSPMGDHCLHANNTPCWVPQAKDIVDDSIRKNLEMCPTIWDYYCELIVLYHAGQMVTSECIKPCQTSQYRLSLDREVVISTDHGYGETILSLWFSTNTITKYKEVKVVFINILFINLPMYVSLETFSCRSWILLTLWDQLEDLWVFSSDSHAWPQPEPFFANCECLPPWRMDIFIFTQSYNMRLTSTLNYIFWLTRNNRGFKLTD